MQIKRWMPALMIIGLCCTSTWAQDPLEVAPEAPPEVAPQAVQKPGDSPYIGLVVVPTTDEVRAQLKLAPGVGLTIMDVIDGSPAQRAGLMRHDIIHKLDDQILINQPQLSALVNLLGGGKTVSLSIYRGGQARQVELTIGLTERQPEMARQMRQQIRFAPGGIEVVPLDNGEAQVNADPREMMENIRRQLEQLQGDLPDDAMRDAQRQRFDAILQQMRQQRMEIGRAGGNVTHAVRMSDGEHVIDIRTENGNKTLKVTDRATGNLVFEGPINTDADRATVPADVLEKVQRFERRANVEIRIDRPAEAQEPAPQEPRPHTLN